MSDTCVSFDIVVAMDRCRGIGAGGGMPWPRLSGDLRYYRELTTAADVGLVEARYALCDAGSGRDFESVAALRDNLADNVPPASPAGLLNAVIMGRLTWESLPPRYRPLPERRNIVVSRRGLGVGSSVHVAPSIEDSVEMAQAARSPAIYVIGGGQLYAAALEHMGCRHVYVTLIDDIYECDVFFPALEPAFTVGAVGHRVREGRIAYQFIKYIRV